MNWLGNILTATTSSIIFTYIFVFILFNDMSDQIFKLRWFEAGVRGENITGIMHCNGCGYIFAGNYHIYALFSLLDIFSFCGKIDKFT